MFVIFINKVFELNTHGLAQYFADDGAYLYSANSIEELNNQIKHDLEIINNWFTANLLNLNLSKTQFIIFDSKGAQNVSDTQDIDFCGTFIKRVTTIKYLGLTFDSNLSWTEHINNIKSKIIPVIFVTYRIRNYVNKNQLWQIYHAYFMSHIRYMNPLWSNAARFKINELQRIQNRMIKTIRFLPRLTPTIELYTTTLNIEKFSLLQTLIIVFKLKNKLLKNNMNFVTSAETHQHNIRNREYIRLNYSRTLRSYRSISASGV